MTKKIVITLNSSWNIFNFRLNLARELSRNGYKVILIAPYDNKYSVLLKKEFEYHEVFINSKSANPIFDLITLIKLYKLYKSIKPDIALHFTIKPNIYGGLVCRFLNIKAVSNITGLGSSFIKKSIITVITKKLYKYSLKKSSVIFFQNSDDRAVFIKDALVDFNKASLIPGSGVDIRKFTPAKYNKKRDVFRFLLIARIIADKGVYEYVKAASVMKKKYKNIEFQLLGAVDDSNPTSISKNQVNSWVKSGVVTFQEFSDDIRDNIKESDCVVLPSYREGVPRTLLESSSMEKPIITTNTPGCREVVDNGINGFLCKVKDSQDLMEKMEKILNMSERERKNMGRYGRKKMVKMFNEEIVINKYLKVISSIKIK